jgi:hypothetical protein
MQLGGMMPVRIKCGITAVETLGGSIEMLKNGIAEHVFDRRFDQRNSHL